MTKTQLKDRWTAHRAEVQAAANKLNVQAATLALRVKRTKSEADRAKLRGTKNLLGQRVAQLGVIDLLLQDIAKW